MLRIAPQQTYKNSQRVTEKTGLYREVEGVELIGDHGNKQGNKCNKGNRD